MSELKAINLNSMGCYNINEPIYLKSEADKVIAELKDDVTYWKKVAKKNMDDNAVMAKQRAKAFKRESHQKYNRCLAMAEMCNARYDAEDAKVNGCGASWEYISKEMKYWERWRWRWEELAEEPTWAKFLQLIRKAAK